MLGKKMEDALNGQVNAELWSAYLYLSMSAYFESLHLKGFANWMRVQVQEELMHAMKLFDHVNGRSGCAILSTVDAPPSEWASPLAAFEATYQHEQKVTGLINDLVSLAESEGDKAASIFLQWFVTEQVEEEASAADIVQKLKLVGDSPQVLFMMDQEMAQRGFTPPTTTETEKA